MKGKSERTKWSSSSGSSKEHIRTNYTEKSIVQNRIDRVDYAEKDETINHIISVYSKLTQKDYKTRFNCVGKVIHWEF